VEFSGWDVDRNGKLVFNGLSQSRPFRRVDASGFMRAIAAGWADQTAGVRGTGEYEAYSILLIFLKLADADVWLV
jgi:hypothetical protein